MTAGIEQEERLEIRNSDLAGQVVTLGQQLLDDGSLILLPNTKDNASTD